MTTILWVFGAKKLYNEGKVYIRQKQKTMKDSIKKKKENWQIQKKKEYNNK